MNKKENENKKYEEVVIEETDEEIGVKNSEKKLKEKLNKCIEERQEYLDGWQRAKADLVNFKKETESQKKDLISFANEKLILDLIPVLDSFDMALLSSGDNEEGKEWRIGMENIYNQFVSILKSLGVEILNPINEKFNPSFHDSIENINIDDKEKDGIIIYVVKKGYNLNKKNIRPAIVKVGQFK